MAQFLSTKHVKTFTTTSIYFNLFLNQIIPDTHHTALQKMTKKTIRCNCMICQYSLLSPHQGRVWRSTRTASLPPTSSTPAFHQAALTLLPHAHKLTLTRRLEIYYFAPGGVQSIAISMSVCVSVAVTALILKIACRYFSDVICGRGSFAQWQQFNVTINNNKWSK